MLWCCSNSNHPLDLICRKVRCRPCCTNSDCGQGGTTHTSGGTTIGPSTEKPADWLIALEGAINAYGDNPPTNLLITLAEGLQKEGFNHDSLFVTQYLQKVIPATELVLLSQTYQIQALSLKELNKLEAAEMAHEMSENMVSMQVLRNRLNRALPKDIGR